MNWKLAQAKQQLSKVVRLAQREPQILQNRDEPVAAVVSAEEFERFREWQRRSGKTLASVFEELRQIAQDESWELEVLPRANRSNPLLESLEVELPAAAKHSAAKTKRDVGARKGRQ